jgi:hypothetical protein
MLDMASSIFNALIPVMAIILGITIGIGLVFMIYKILKGAFPSS